MIEGIQKMAVDESVENEGQRTGGLDLMQRVDCSQIENEEEQESWQERDQMAAQWDEEQKLEESLGQRGMEGSLGQFEATRRVLELVVHETTGSKVSKKRRKYQDDLWKK